MPVHPAAGRGCNPRPAALLNHLNHKGITAMIHLRGIPCPYCNNSTLLVKYGETYQRYKIQNKHMATLICFISCSSCIERSLCSLSIEEYSVKDFGEHINSKQPYTEKIQNIEFIQPLNTKIYTHESIPDHINAPFSDIQRMLIQKMSAPLIISLCRNLIESISINLGSDVKGLFNKIKSLKEKEIINNTLFDWANHIRLEGNDATHEMKGTFEEAKEIVNFVHIFLQYTYELPYMINKAKMSREQK
jgi:hypothetical protein